MHPGSLERGDSLRFLAAAAGVLAALAFPKTYGQPVDGLPPPSATERRAIGTSVRVDAIEIDGPALLDRAAFDRITRPYIGRMVSVAELRALAATLTQRVEAAGYLGSRVQLPDQELKDAIVRLRVVPARLIAVSISPATFWNRQFALAAWLLPRGEETLHVPTLQDRLVLLRESGLVERVNVEIVPFDERGMAYAALVTVEESLPLRVTATYANNRSPSIGARRSELILSHRSLLGMGDAFEARLGRTEGLDDSTLAYRLPVVRTPLALVASRVRSASLAVDPPVFRDLDITAVADTDTAGIEWSVARTVPFSATLRYTHDRRRSRTQLLGIPFSFVPGVLDGVSTARVHRIAAEATERREAWSASGRAQWSQGTTNSDMSLGEFASDARFKVLGVSGAFVRQLARDWGQVRARLDGQYTRERLFPFERLAIGGSATVRGYRENLVLRDTGAIASIEWRTRDFTFLSGNVVTGAGAFVDAGWGKNARGGLRDGPATLASVGVTLRVELWRHFTANVAWALPRDRGLTDRRDLQDRGVHYWLAASWP